MAGKTKDVPAVIDFDSPDWDAKDGDVLEKQEVCGAMLDIVLSRAGEYITEASFSRRVLEQTVDSTIEAALCTVDTLFVARENEIAVTPISHMHASWEPEPEPVPCSVDTWLRAAIPESSAENNTFLMSEFLRSPSPAQLQPARSLDQSGPKRSVPEGAQAGTPVSAPPPPPASPPSHAQGKAGKAGRARRSSQQSPLEGGKVLSPEQAAAEDRLREELEIRKAQLAGRIVPMSAFNADSSQQLQWGADFRLQSPDSSALQQRQSPSTGKTGGKGRGSGGAQTKPPAERKLVNDFREAPSRSQPNALEVMNVNSGVTLRQGSQAKSGPQRQHHTMGMTREEFLRYAKEHARTASTPAASNTRPTQPISFPPITTANPPTAPNTGHGNRAARNSANAQSAMQHGLHNESSSSSVSDLNQPQSQQQPNQQPSQTVHLPPLPNIRGSSGATAQAAAQAEVEAEVAGPDDDAPFGGLPPQDKLTARFGSVFSQQQDFMHAQKSGRPGRIPGAVSHASMRSSFVDSEESDGSRPASSKGAVPRGVVQDPLSAYPDSPSRSEIAKPKTPNKDAPAKPPTPDPNPFLVTTSDWGSCSGSGRQQSGAALPASKPDLKALEAEVGRSMRLPRDRASQATIAAPVSPLKMAALQQQQQRPRSMTFAA
ncbi:hypothetical protein DUNSADRAFT_9932 [Dunaliella salina]|uniref:Uncharacterized protein n=1 Tax=Dunaliella salina TaxID=3046 RepID=A0ABQ7GGG7_DUNSA|nr:hypothetical protein DUNSADRAFT_9932 [Dunaliella salina]|eukprot:KAF5833699.1 hypothetical protein DUNSADRAFT_9932 [Dunaliella salina]